MSMPDWRKLKDYEYTNGLDGPGWAWEFLRRDIEFRKDYIALTSGSLTDDFGNYPVSLSETNLLFTSGEYFLFPPLSKGESVSDWASKICDEQDRKFLTPYNYLLSKWGLKQEIPDPHKNSIENEKKVEFYSLIPKVFDYWSQLEELPLLLVNNEEANTDGEEPIRIAADRAIVQFSLEKPFNEQLILLRNQLNKRKRAYSKTFKTKHSLLLRRLRVLDAKQEKSNKKKKTKLTNSDIRKEIYGCKENATEQFDHDNDLKFLKKFKSKEAYATLSRLKIQ